MVSEAIIFPIAGATKTNRRAIIAAVNACFIDTGLIIDRILDETITAKDIVTITSEEINASFKVIGPPEAPLILATLSNAKATSTIPIPSAIIDITLTFPTILKANPIANTATAISSIVANPFLRAPVFFGSPASEIGSFSPPFLSSSFFLANPIRVF